MTSANLLLVYPPGARQEALAGLLRSRWQLWTSSSRSEAFEHLGARDFDAILVGAGVLGQASTELLEELRYRCPRAISVLIAMSDQAALVADATNQQLVERVLIEPVDKGSVLGELQDALLEGPPDRGLQSVARRASEAVRTTDERLQQIVEGVDEIIYSGLFAIDPTERGEVTFVSPQVNTILGVSRDQAIGSLEPLFARIHPDDLEAVEEANAVVRGGAPATCLFRIRHAAPRSTAGSKTACCPSAVRRGLWWASSVSRVTSRTASEPRRS